MKTHEKRGKEMPGVKEKKNRKSGSFTGEPKGPSTVEGHQHLDSNEDTTARISFLIDFSLAEGEILGKITHRLTSKQQDFIGLDQTTITQFMKKYLSRLEKSIVRMPVAEPPQQIPEFAEKQMEEVNEPSTDEMLTRSFGVFPAGAAHSTAILQQGQPFQIQWSFEPISSSNMEGAQMHYKVMIAQKKLSGGVRELAGEIEGEIDFGDELTARIPSEALPPGMYHLEAVSYFSLKSRKPEWRSSCRESRLIQVI